MHIQSAEFVIGAANTADFPSDGRPDIAFAGRSNVGKSSLINRLVRRRKLARTSSTPGKTQQINYYLVNGSFYLVDLPGYGFVKGGMTLRSELGLLTKAYLNNRRELKAVIQLIDIRRGPSENDLLMIDWLQVHKKPFLVVFTKTDKLSTNKCNRQIQSVCSAGTLSSAPYTLVSAVSGEGCVDIWDWSCTILKSL